MLILLAQFGFRKLGPIITIIFIHPCVINPLKNENWCIQLNNMNCQLEASHADLNLVVL